MSENIIGGMITDQVAIKKFGKPFVDLSRRAITATADDNPRTDTDEDGVADRSAIHDANTHP